MNMRAPFAYAQARCQARFAMRMHTHGRNTASTLQPDHPSHPGLAGLSETVEQHELERRTRLAFHRHVAEVAGWVPADWRAAFRWISLLIDLPAIQYLLDGSEPYPWFHKDEYLIVWLRSASQGKAGAKELREWAPLLKQRIDDETLTETWVRCWHQHWPHYSNKQHAALLRLERLVSRIRYRLLQSEKSGSIDVPVHLEQRLIGIFRYQIQSPAAVFAYLGLAWLDISRLRRDFIERRLARQPS